MHRSRWIWIGIATAVWLWASMACKCGKKADQPAEHQAAGPDYESTVFKLPKAKHTEVAAMIPADAALVAVSANLRRLLDFLDGQKWFQEAKKSPVVQDLRFSEGWFKLSTIKHRIEALSAVRLKKTSLKEVMSTPVGLAVRPAKQGPEWLLIKQIDLKVQALDRLVEVLNQIAPREGLLTTKEVQGLQMRDLRLSDKNHLYYLLFSNMLLVSNTEAYLLQATELARGESSGSVLDDPDMKSRLEQLQKGSDLVVVTNLGRWIPGKRKSWLADLAPFKQLTLSMNTGSPAHLSVTGDLGPANPGSRLNSTYSVGKLLPLDSRIVLDLAHLDLARIFRRAAARVKGPETLPKEIRLGVANQLIGGLENQMVLVLGGFDLQGQRPVPQAGVLLKIKEGKAAQVATMALKLFTFLFNEKPKLKSLAKMSNKKIRVLAGKRTFAPAFAMVDGWLAICTTEGMLTRLVATSMGQAPAIQDVPGFSTKILAAGKEYFALSYANFDLLFEDSKAYAKALVGLGDRFDAAAVEETVVPLFEALKKVGKFGGALTQQGTDVSGRVVSL